MAGRLHTHAAALTARHRTLLGVVLPTVVMAAHVAAIAPWYSVGSFDDDAGYVLAARALAAGHGLTAHLANGTVVAGSAPPGYPLLITPLVWLWPHTFVPLRVLSALCAVAVVPLTWSWLRRTPAGEVVAGGACWLLALNPVLATFGSMVMAEAPFLVVFLLLLRARRAWAMAAAAVAMVWLKEAAIGLDAGLVLWLALGRQWRKGVVVGGAIGASLVPVVVARHLAGVALAGSRYTSELGSYYRGGLAGRVLHVLPTGLHQLASTALPASVVPRGAPLWTAGAGEELLRIVAWQVTILTVVGALWWVRRARDLVAVAVPAYLLESLLWPFVNERRTILVLPVLLGWYVLGVVVAGRWARRALRLGAPTGAALGGALVVVVVAAPLVAQFPRDYLFSVFQHTSRPEGSRYMRLLAALPPGTVESDYPSTTALFSGQPTAETAFVANQAPGNGPVVCQSAAADLAGVEADRAAYLLAGDLNKAHQTGNPCMLAWATTAPQMVRLMRGGPDAASVFELVGPGTVHPGLVDLTGAGARVDASGSVALDPVDAADTPGSAPYSAGPGAVTVTWAAPTPVAQVSIGGAHSLDGRTGPVELQMLEGSGWVTVAHAPSGVGDVPGGAPYLLVRPAGVAAAGVRVVLAGTGRLAAIDLHVLGTPVGVGPPGP
ncbi:MAG TPA: hypothetical protein VFP61_04505 [Acidimicrobiales bacterium]|nr:hypothetical protein [Acidimicrobiales bacterium]